MTKILFIRLLLLVAIILLVLSFCARVGARSFEFSWLDKISDANKEILKYAELKHSAKLVTYKEKRLIPSRNPKKKPKVVTTKRTDYVWKEIGLALMNVESGKIHLIKVRKEGQKLFNMDKEFMVEIEPRVNGITWNGRNTAFRVVAPEGWAVIANKWTERISGKPVERIYFPYSTAVHVEELVLMGDTDLEFYILAAFGWLYSTKTKSLAQPEERVDNVVPIDFLKNLVLTELTDPQEFYAFRSGILKYNPFERVKVLLASNGQEAFSTYNYAGAIGLTQFTKRTWNVVRKSYPSAKLPEFNIGATQHVKSIKAAALLYDYNLNELIKAFGTKILDDEKLDYYLYAAHNCGISRVIKAIKLTKPSQDWRIALRKLSKTDETIMFLEKIDYLVSAKNK